MLAEELKASDVGLEFLTGELKGLQDPAGIVFTVPPAISGMERWYIRVLEGRVRPQARQDHRRPYLRGYATNWMTDRGLELCALAELATRDPYR